MAHTEAQLMQVPPEGETRQPVSEDNPLSVLIENQDLRFGFTRAPQPNVRSVGDSASSAQLLAANAARRGAMFYNTSTAILYLRFGGEAATTSMFTVAVAGSGGYYEVPFGYTGAIAGIWASDAGGVVLITEVA